MTSNTVHVYPDGDFIEHDTDTDGCVCGPTVEHVTPDGGGTAWLYTHHPLNPNFPT